MSLEPKNWVLEDGMIWESTDCNVGNTKKLVCAIHSLHESTDEQREVANFILKACKTHHDLVSALADLVGSVPSAATVERAGNVLVNAVEPL